MFCSEKSHRTRSVLTMYLPLILDKKKSCHISSAMRAIMLLPLTLQLALFTLAPILDAIPRCDMSKSAVACHHATQDSVEIRSQGYDYTMNFSKAAGLPSNQTCLCESKVVRYNERIFAYSDSMDSSKFQELCDEVPNYAVSTCLTYEPCGKQKDRSNIVCYDTKHDYPSMRDTDFLATIVSAQKAGSNSDRWCSCADPSPTLYGRSFLYVALSDLAGSPVDFYEEFAARCRNLTDHEVATCASSGPSKRENEPSTSKEGKRKKLCAVRKSKS